VSLGMHNRRDQQVAGYPSPKARESRVMIGDSSGPFSKSGIPRQGRRLSGRCIRAEMRNDSWTWVSASEINATSKNLESEGGEVARDY
jgi:hypothetical protein